MDNMLKAGHGFSALTDTSIPHAFFVSHIFPDSQGIHDSKLATVIDQPYKCQAAAKAPISLPC